MQGHHRWRRMCWRTKADIPLFCISARPSCSESESLLILQLTERAEKRNRATTVGSVLRCSWHLFPAEFIALAVLTQMRHPTNSIMTADIQIQKINCTTAFSQFLYEHFHNKRNMHLLSMIYLLYSTTLWFTKSYIHWSRLLAWLCFSPLSFCVWQVDVPAVCADKVLKAAMKHIDIIVKAGEKGLPLLLSFPTIRQREFEQHIWGHKSSHPYLKLDPKP